MTIGRAQASRLVEHSLEILFKGARTQRGRAKAAARFGLAKSTVERQAKDLGPDGLRDLLLSTVYDDLEWMGFNESLRVGLDSLIGAEGVTRTSIIDALEANLSVQLRSNGFPVGLGLHALAMPASTFWEGRAVSDEEAELARAVLDARRCSYDRMRPGVESFVDAALLATHRKPTPDWPSDKVLAVLWSLVEGGVLRVGVGDGSLTTRDVAEAMLLLGEALTEPCSGTAADDPRRIGIDASVLVHFDAIVVEATERYLAGASQVAVNDASTAAGVPTELWVTVDRWFPTWKALADSCLRSAIQGAVTADAAASEAGPRILVTLRRLAAVVDSAPDLVRAVSEARPASIPPASMITSLGYAFAAWAAAEPRMEGVDPDKIVDAALNGSAALRSELDRQLG